MLREEMLSSTLSALGGVADVGGEWRKAGRPSAPRILFTFARAPIRPDLGYIKRSELIQKLESSLETQIYALLRKSRVIQNNSSAAIGTVPAKMEFVHVFGPGESPPDTTTQLLALLHSVCPLNGSPGPLVPNPSPLMSATFDDEKKSDEGRRFHAFLMRHIDAAHGDGFQDNVGKGVPPAHFELTRFASFVGAAAALNQLFVIDDLPKELAAQFYKHFDTERQFSKSRCAKSYPMAFRAYKEGLPEFYQRRQHEDQLERAVVVLRSQGRGPCLADSEAELRSETAAWWAAGRRGCEVSSLSGNLCSKAVHDGDLHESAARFLSTCNCGSTQALREDPFTLKEANVYFYQSIKFMCCTRKEAFPFPLRTLVRAPSSARVESAAAALHKLAVGEGSQAERSATPGGGSSGTEERIERDNQMVVSPSNVAQTSSDGMAGEVDRSGEAESQEPPLAAKSGVSEEEERGEDVNSLLDPEEDAVDSSQDETSQLDDDMANRGAGNRGYDDDESKINMDDTLNDESSEDVQTIVDSKKPVPTEKSAEELIWDEWMPFSGVGCDVLPTFPSWSLVCLGPGSQYQHSSGLRDQPNFSHGSNFLLPWDVTLKVDVDKWATALEALIGSSSWPAKKSAKVVPKRGGEASVRLYVGLEYECPRGHRFVLAAPDRILKHPQGSVGGPKDSGAWLSRSDATPLWFPCSCRSTPPMSGQLMRLHVVTPKAPVTVALNPRVQPEPRHAIHFHSATPPPAIPLNPAKYYILRFPYSYKGPKGPYFPPKEPIPTGKLLKGILSVLPDLP